MEAKFKDLQVGDKVIRMLGGVIRMELIVTKVDNELVTCSHPPEKYGEVRQGIIDGAAKVGQSVSEEELEDAPTWTFSINNGAEIDPMLGWTEQVTGSYIVKPQKI